MKRIFKLANAEFQKIFFRPSIFVLTAFLIITLVLTNLLYSPVKSTTKLIYEGKNNVGQVYTTFTGTSTKEVTKQSILDDFNNRFKEVDNEYKSIMTTSNKLKDFKDLVGTLQAALTKHLQQEIIKVNNSLYTDEKFEAEKNNPDGPLTLLNNVKQTAKDLLDFLYALEREPFNFYMYYNQYNKIVKEIKNFTAAFPTNFNDYNKTTFISFSQALINNYELKASAEVVSEVQKDPLVIKPEDYDPIVETYYTNALTTLEETYFKQIDDFYNEHSTSDDEQDIKTLNEYIANYYSFAQMNIKVLEDKFLLLKIGKKSDTELKGLIGFKEVSQYNINEKIQINEYLIKNNKFDYNYLNSFNFNKASGDSSNVYDYTVYSMQILSILIIVFTSFYACSSIAGDQTSGTMKMIAIRPFTRTKLFYGKYLACVLFGLLLMFVSFLASFVVGIASFGITMKNCLVVFNSSTIITVNPLVMMLLYLISLSVNLLFYISLAMFICLIFKSNTLSVFLTNVVFATQIVLNGVINHVWLKYTIFGHFDLFKYFGNSQFGFLSMNILPDSNFLISALVLGFSIVLMNIVSHFIFKKRDIA